MLVGGCSHDGFAYRLTYGLTYRLIYGLTYELGFWALIHVVGRKCHTAVIWRGSHMCSTAIGGGPFSINLPPKLAVSHNMAGIYGITQL